MVLDRKLKLTVLFKATVIHNNYVDLSNIFFKLFPNTPLSIDILNNNNINPFEPTRFPAKLAPGTAIFQGFNFFVPWHEEFLITA